MKEFSKFYSSLGLLIILNVIIKPVWIFGIDRQVQNVVGTEAYGVYFSLFNFSIVFSFLLDWGFTAFFNRQLAAQKENFIGRVGHFLFIKLLFAILYVGVVCLVAKYSHIHRWDILWGVMAIQVLTSLFVFFRSIITAQQWFRTDAWLSVLDKTLMIFCCGTLLYFPAVFGAISIIDFLLFQVASTLLAIACAVVILVKKKIRFVLRSNLLPDRQLLLSALPFAIIVFLMSVHSRLDGFLLERLHKNGAYETGIYAAAYRLLDAANMIGYLLASFLLPFIARQFSKGENSNEVILNSRHLLLVFSLAVVTTIVFMAPWLQQLLYHNSDREATSILQWCLPALIGYSLVQVYGTVMTATGHIIPFCYITLISVVINVTLNLLLIPQLGAKACCIAALASQGFCGIATLIYSSQKTGTNINFQSVLMYIFIAAVLCGFFYYGKELIVSRWLLIAGAIFITIAAAIATKLFTIRKWLKLYKRDSG